MPRQRRRDELPRGPYLTPDRMIIVDRHEALSGWWEVEGLTSADFRGVWVGKGAATLADSYVNLATPGTNDLTVGVAPTLGANGWVANGSAYLKTGIILAYTDSIIVWFTGMNAGSTTTQALCGAYYGTGPKRAQLLPIYVGDSKHLYGWGTNIMTIGTRLSSGSMGFAGGTYKNGVADGTLSYNDNMPQYQCYLMGQNNAGSLSTPMLGGSIVAAAVMNTTISANQMAALHNAGAAL